MQNVSLNECSTVYECNIIYIHSKGTHLAYDGVSTGRLTGNSSSVYWNNEENNWNKNKY